MVSGRYPSCSHQNHFMRLLRAGRETGISSHFFVSDPPSPSKRALIPKRNTSTGGLRTSGYPDAVEPLDVIMSAFTIHFNIFGHLEDDSKLGNHQTLAFFDNHWKKGDMDVTNQDDCLQKNAKESIFHGYQLRDHAITAITIPTAGLCTKGSMAMLEDTKVCTSVVSEKRRTLKAPGAARTNKLW